MLSTSKQHARLPGNSPVNLETMNSHQSRALLTILRNQNHPEHQRYWAALAEHLQRAFQLAGRPLRDPASELERLRRDLESYKYQGRLQTWLMVRIARYCRLDDDSANPTANEA